MVKFISEKTTDKVLGVHIIGPVRRHLTWSHNL